MSAPHSFHLRNFDIYINIEYACLAFFDIKFTSLSKYGTERANFFNSGDFSSFSQFLSFSFQLHFTGQRNGQICPNLILTRLFFSIAGVLLSLASLLLTTSVVPRRSPTPAPWQDLRWLRSTQLHTKRLILIHGVLLGLR